MKRTYFSKHLRVELLAGPILIGVLGLSFLTRAAQAEGNAMLYFGIGGGVLLVLSAALFILARKD